MKGRAILYIVSELEWLSANRTMSIAEYTTTFNTLFGRDVREMHLHALRKRQGWRTGRTGCFEKGSEPHNKGRPFPAAHSPGAARNQFERGHLPHNTKFAGHERVSKDGYVEISVEETNPHTGYERRYVLKHRRLWEAANGPPPAGHVLKCLDGDKCNTEPANWQPVPRAILPRLNGGRRKTHLAYDDAPSELKPAILTTAKLEHRLREIGDRPRSSPTSTPAGQQHE